MRVRFDAPLTLDLEAFFLRELVHAGWRVELAGDDSSEVALEIDGHGFFGQVEIAQRSRSPGSMFVVQLV